MSRDDDSGEALRWLREFERQHSRRLRVLHIGNIANNAYNNAKIQRRRGIDADVVCHDYYHVMGSPEWEDAEFTGDVVDEFYPDWWNVDLGGFERPDWFAQGTMHTCVRYLRARVCGDRATATRLRRRLERERWLRTRSTSVARVLRRVAGRDTRTAWAIPALHRRLVGAGRAMRAAARGEPPRSVLMHLLPVRLTPRAWRVHARRDDDLARRFRAAFPLRRDQVSADDYYALQAEVPTWNSLLREYDVVQGYSTDGVIPLLAGTRRWTAYEHGTLREIPFEDSPRGRLCALTYHEAPGVFVTNSDVLPSVARLGLDPTRVVYLPHAVDTDRLFAFGDEHAHVVPSEPVTLYAPSRQDWVDGDASWSKGNDVFLRAAAALAARHEFRLALAEWGRDLAATRALLDELGLTDRVEWVRPLRKRELWTRYLESHVVIDQFALRALGGVAFEAMALGRRVITAVDARQTTEFFGRTPPVLAAADTDEVAAALAIVFEDPDDDAARGAAARAWVADVHSADRIVELQARVYRTLVEDGVAPAAAHA